MHSTYQKDKKRFAKNVEIANNLQIDVFLYHR